MSEQKITINNPLFLWQFLRRNELYKREVDEYRNNMSSGELEIFEALKDKESMRKLIMGIEYYEGSHEKEPNFNSLNDISVANIFGGPEFLIGYVDFKSSAFMSFYQKFGDTLSFPLDYEIETPCAWAFRSVWSLSPAKIRLPTNASKLLQVDLLTPYEKNSINISIDVRFSQKQIFEAVGLLLDAVAKKYITLSSEEKLNIEGINGIGDLAAKNFALLSGRTLTYEDYLFRLKYYDLRKLGYSQVHACRDSGLKLKSNDDKTLRRSLSDSEKTIDSIINAFDPAIGTRPNEPRRGE